MPPTPGDTTVLSASPATASGSNIVIGGPICNPFLTLYDGGALTLSNVPLTCTPLVMSTVTNIPSHWTAPMAQVVRSSERISPIKVTWPATPKVGADPCT